MKKSLFLFGTVLVLIAEIVVLIVFAVGSSDISLSTVAANDVVQSVAHDFDNMETHQKTTALDYVVLDSGGNVLFKTKSGLSENINAAISHRDTILDVTVGGEVKGKVIIYNDGAQELDREKRTTVTVLSVAIAVQCAICICYAVYLYVTVVKPFRRLKGFAERVAAGNLDIPLEMDRGNLFGAFTESFDIMRSELKRARLDEAQANASKKELVAKLSHDIKTPVASIKAVSEVGLAVAKNAKDKSNYNSIITKADEINSLVTNLFTATLEELKQLSVSPVDTESGRLKTMLGSADYRRRASIPDIPECLVRVDLLRLQQVFDNIFANSYKYADTDIFVTATKSGGGINIVIEDEGGGVPDKELAILKEKFKRGSNASEIEGAGLGLYISDYFMKEMGGELLVENGERGLRVTVALPFSASS